MSNNQAGGIVSFVVIGLVLAGLLGGGLYLSKQQARQARDSDTTTPQVTVNEKETEAETESGTAGVDEERDVPATTTPQSTPKPATPAPQPAQPQRQPATGSTNRVATTGPSDSIPATGPKETAAVVSVLAIITFAGYRFVDARRGFLRASLRR